MKQSPATSTAAASHPIPGMIALDYEEGQAVTLLAGAKVSGLTTRCNQPGKVVHIQYSAEFGVTYVVAFGKLNMMAYVSASGLEAVAEAAPVVTTPESSKNRPFTDDLMLKPTTKRVTPSWMKGASKGNGCCAKCKTQYAKSELNAQKHCRHCADELGEAHPLNR